MVGLKEKVFDQNFGQLVKRIVAREVCWRDKRRLNGVIIMRNASHHVHHKFDIELLDYLVSRLSCPWMLALLGLGILKSPLLFEKDF